MFKRKNIEIKNVTVCAPLAGITNYVYRKIAKEFGAGLTYTEMISDKALVYNSENTYEMMKTYPGESPIALQLFGGEEEFLIKAVKIINDDSQADFLDINMGCPVPKVIKSKAGSYWLKDIEDSYNKVKLIVENSKKPVTVKIRIGWDSNSINVVEMAKAMEKAGVSMICVHARTRSQLYSGKADYSYIKMVKDSVNIPVIGNGDVKSVQDAIRMKKETNCDGIMIGRGALGNPWIFREINTYFETGEILARPSLKDKIEMCKRHAIDLCDLKGENIAIKEMRSHLAWYLKGEKNSTNVKVIANKTEKLIDFLSLLDQYLIEEGE